LCVPPQRLHNKFPCIRICENSFDVVFGTVAICVGIDWRDLRSGEDTGSGSKVNRRIGEFLGHGLLAVDFAHGDLTRGEQCPEQHCCGLGRRQHGLGFDPALELFMEPFDRVGGANALPLAGRQLGEGEEPVTSLLEAVGYRLAFETAVKALAKVRGLAQFCCSDRRNGRAKERRVAGYAREENIA